MDTFFQKLRDIQKKERNTGSLSEIDDSFYDDASNYLQDLLKTVDKNPLSLEAYQLRDAQRITIEICERREFKIISTAIANVQKSHDIFKGHRKDSELYDIIPYNTTPEEEKLYRDIINTIINHRESLMEEIIPQGNKIETKIGFKPNKKESSKRTKVKKQKFIEESNIQEPITDKPSKPSLPKLDASQVAMMFGQAPDDVLLDENNKPIKETKPKTDITTPFKPPEIPEEDTITLQNSNTKTNEIKNEISGTDEVNIEENKSSRTNNNEINTKETLEESVAVTSKIETEYDSEEVVFFKDNILTDILDESEKTYGPFEVGDIALLPKSIVTILVHKEVIDVIK